LFYCKYFYSCYKQFAFPLGPEKNPLFVIFAMLFNVLHSGTCWFTSAT